jgi:D-lactate dehydrogenase
MKIIFYSTKDFELPYLLQANTKNCIIRLATESLSLATTAMAKDAEVVSVFTGDDVSAPVIEQLYLQGVRYITTRAAGYDNIDIQKANELGIAVANVPEYSPHAIAEHAVAMILAMNRKLVLADKQVHANNFTVGNLVGFDLNGKTAGIIGTGRIGSIAAKILDGFGCKLLAYDIRPNRQLENTLNLRYTSLEELCVHSDIITIHTPLSASSRYLVNGRLLQKMKKGVTLVNTSRGPIINTADVIEFLQNGHIGYFGMDVYEKEKGIFFFDHTGEHMADEQLKTLLSLPNVLVTPHQAFATNEALTNIASVTFYNIDCWNKGIPTENELVHPGMLKQLTISGNRLT